MITLFIAIAFAAPQFENLDEEIRYQDDPHYAEYLLQKNKQKELEIKAQKEQRQTRKKQIEKANEARKAYIIERDKRRAQKTQEDLEGEKLYKEKLRKKKKLQKEKEKKFLSQQSKKKQQLIEKKTLEMAKMREKLSRLPSSVKQRPAKKRVIRKFRKFK